jgi:uncharacterized protein YheU (UPF0270 family)
VILLQDFYFYESDLYGNPNKSVLYEAKVTNHTNRRGEVVKVYQVEHRKYEENEVESFMRSGIWHKA